MSIALAASNGRLLLVIDLAVLPARRGREPLDDEIAKPLAGLLLLIAAHQVAGVLAGVAEVVAGNPTVDGLAQRLGRGKVIRVFSGTIGRQAAAARPPAPQPAPGATQAPDLPPRFSSTRTPSITMPRSAALSMS